MSDLMTNLKSLRDTTGAGFLDCKIALEKNNNEIDKSIEYLRIKGLAKANKKSSRITNEGIVSVFSNQNKTILIEVNTETDFVAKNDIFLNFIDKIGEFSLQISNENLLNNDLFLKQKLEEKALKDHFNDLVAKIGENIILKRIKLITGGPNIKIFTYTHNSYRNNIGKICVALKTEVQSLNDESIELGKNLCMHIAALKPLSIDIDSLDQNIISKEKEIHLENIKSSGKPDNIINKILEGKMNKFYSEITLLNQNMF